MKQLAYKRLSSKVCLSLTNFPWLPHPLSRQILLRNLKVIFEGLLIPDAIFSVQNFTGLTLKLNAAWAISLAELLHRNIKLLFTVKIHCQISVTFFQDSSGLKRKSPFSFFPFLFPTCTLLNVQKIIGYF